MLMSSFNKIVRYPKAGHKTAEQKRSEYFKN